MLTAAITAGGRVDSAFASVIGTSVKALAPLGSARLIDLSIAAAREAGAARVIVVGNGDVRAHCGSAVDDVVEAVDDGRENLRRALHAAGENALLFMTSDLPFVDGASARAFLLASASAGVAMPLADESAYRSAFPGAAPHATAIGGERVVNGSVFYFAAGVAPRVDAIAQQFFEARKSLWRMAALTGPGLLLKFAVRRLKIADLEARAQQVLGVRALGVRGSPPSLCYDVDSLDDYRYAVARLARG